MTRVQRVKGPEQSERAIRNEGGFGDQSVGRPLRPAKSLRQRTYADLPSVCPWSPRSSERDSTRTTGASPAAISRARNSAGEAVESWWITIAALHQLLTRIRPALVKVGDFPRGDAQTPLDRHGLPAIPMTKGVVAG
jgi:hypothetical protein